MWPQSRYRGRQRVYLHAMRSPHLYTKIACTAKRNFDHQCKKTFSTASVKPGNDGCASSGHMRRYREPFPVLLRPAIGVAPVRLLSVRRGVTERRMDDGEVAHNADLYIMRLQILDRHRLRGLLKE